ncbi:MAG TPA: IS630 family transposase [Pyrinomonadaceae bacterium]|nr:IS630 family transposase [Pyrinomonadaceae bacterium]
MFIDETGVNLAFARLYGRAPRGQRAIGATPKNYGESVTLIGAIDRNGLFATLSFRGATDTEAMKAFLKEFLLPELNPGDCVIWDNLAVHKTHVVQDLFRQAKVELLFLPPYSPDLNPIEMCWSKLNTYLRSVSARTYEALLKAISAAIKKITATDAQNWIRHCVYVSHLP